MSLVTQVQDLFPDLGSGFVMKLLDEYQDDVEQVTAHLLDDSLPPHLADLDRSEQAPAHDTHQQAVAETLVPRSTPPPPQSFVPERRNVFDEDEFDRADFDVSRLHIGKRNKSVTSADEPNKAAILSALAAFDSDDDERDDTYDFEDVGGTVDNTAPDGEPGLSGKASGEENDMALFGAYQSAPEMFGRSFDVRKGQARRALKAETGMTDEQIEGWAIMLQRDPKRLQRLQAQTGTFDGRQTELAGTAYHGSAGNTETEDSDHAGRGGFRGRGRGRGRGGRGGGGPRGDVAGPSNDQNTANAQRKKEANKSSRANHNRRDQRARKMARGGFPG
jgi:activating signal cointegrator complex subunit 2